MSTFAANLRSIRKKRGLTQVQLAAFINSTQQAISLFECGKREPNMKDLIALCTALETDYSSLIEHGSPHDTARSKRPAIRPQLGEAR